MRDSGQVTKFDVDVRGRFLLAALPSGHSHRGRVQSMSELRLAQSMVRSQQGYSGRPGRLCVHDQVPSILSHLPVPSVAGLKCTTPYTISESLLKPDRHSNFPVGYFRPPPELMVDNESKMQLLPYE